MKNPVLNRRNARFALLTVATMVMSATRSLQAQVDPAGLVGSAADNSGRLILIGGIVAVLAIGGWFMIMWRRREPIPRYSGGKEVESSQYEQVLAEIQGIRLRISGGDGRSYLPKVERLIHIFADRAGVIGGRNMDREALTKALSGISLAPEHIRVLGRILLQCEKARTEESVKLDFDPMDMVKDFQAIVQELDRGEAA
jgi:hypothetical protein